MLPAHFPQKEQPKVKCVAEYSLAGTQIIRIFKMFSLIQESSDMTQVTALQCSVFRGGGDIPTLSYFPLVRQLVGDPVRVIDVGCGQGEFVKSL